jgi:hypothetical protein
MNDLEQKHDAALKKLSEERNQKLTQCLNDLIYEYIHGKTSLKEKRKDKYIPLPIYIAQCQKWQDLIPTDIPYPITKKHELWENDLIAIKYTLDKNIVEDFENQRRQEDCIKTRFVACIVGFFLCDRPQYDVWRISINPKWKQLAFNPKSKHNERFDLQSLFS